MGGSLAAFLWVNILLPLGEGKWNMEAVEAHMWAGTSCRLRRVVVVAPSFLFLVISFFSGQAHAASNGAIVQKSGVSGCISSDGSGGECATATAINGVTTVWTSPDGANAYALTGTNSSIAAFARDEETGSLTQLSGTDGCISATGNSGACEIGTFLGGLSVFTFSDDGRTIYGASQADKALLIFDRDPASGAITQRAGVNGCFHDTGGSGQCVDAVALDAPVMALIDDSEMHLYLSTGTGIAIFDRDPVTGDLTQKPGTAGCITATGHGGQCQTGIAVDGANSMALSSDGGNLYVSATNSDAVAIFDVDPETGEIDQKAGAAGCISLTGTGGACTQGVALDNANSGTLSNDGQNYYVMSTTGNSIAIFDRDLETGVLTQKAGTAACISDDGSGGLCGDAAAPMQGTYSGFLTSDDRNFITNASTSGAVVTFNRDMVTGDLIPVTGEEFCVAEVPIPGTCSDGKELSTIASVLLSPDGRNIYAANISSNSISVLDRLIPDVSTVSSVDFGASVEVDAGAATYQVEVGNTGDADLTVASATISGTHASDFRISGDTCSSTVVPAGGTCVVSVVFDPSAAGARSGELVISHDAGVTGLTTLALGGSGAAAQVSTGTTSGTTIVDTSCSPLNVAACAVETVSGTHEGDQIWGFFGADLIHGLQGNDMISGGPGNDRIYGDAGGDRLKGGGGDDLLDGGLGDDVLAGRADNDTLRGGSGNDLGLGGDGSDALFGGRGRDTLGGGAGGDIVYGGAGNDVLRGGKGVDQIFGGAGRDILDARDDRSSKKAKKLSVSTMFFGEAVQLQMPMFDNRHERAKSKGDFVKCGKGRDRVRADANDRVARDCEIVNGRGRRFFR